MKDPIDELAVDQGLRYRIVFTPREVMPPPLYVRHLSDIGPVARLYPEFKFECTELGKV